MNEENLSNLKLETLKAIFNNVAKPELHNKEVAALMGEIIEDNPEILPGGIRSKYGFSNVKVSQLKKKKKDKAIIELILRQSIHNALIRINEIIEYHQNQLEGILKKLEVAQELLEKLDEQHQILEPELNSFQENGVFDLDEIGKLRITQAEEILFEWERKTGKIIDRNDPASYEFLLTILLDIEKRRIELKKNIDYLTHQYEHHKIKLEKAQQIKTDLESDDQDKQLNAISKYDQLFRNFNQTKELNLVQTPAATDVDNIIKDEFLSAFPPMQEEFLEAVSRDEEPDKKELLKPTKDQTNMPKSNG